MTRWAVFPRRYWRLWGTAWPELWWKVMSCVCVCVCVRVEDVFVVLALEPSEEMDEEEIPVEMTVNNKSFLYQTYPLTE